MGIYSKQSDNRNSPSDTCYQQLRRLLIHGQIVTGKRLTETKWSKELNVYRSAFREAVNLLVHEGLLLRGERGGVFVPALEKSDCDEIQEMRVAIEVGALKLASLRGLTLRNFGKMNKAIAVMKQTLEDGFGDGFEFGFCEADWRFHEALVEMVGNQRLLRMYRQSPLLISFMAHTQVISTQAARKKTLQEHTYICQFLKEGAFEQAIDLLEEHLFTSIRLNEPQERSMLGSKQEPMETAKANKCL